MELHFSTDYASILEKIEQIDPVQYGQNRNYIDGNITYLSPYISRGVISTKMVLQSVIKRGYHLKTIEPFVKELCWRDYFQRIAQHKNINQALKHAQEPIAHFEVPTAILQATTGIEGIDTAIKLLYHTGYMHNHCRMYTASVVCNIAHSHWLNPAQWMYYHLLDGDWASNACSWQWVAGANSSKKYYANQENINKYTRTNQTNTFLDTTYEDLPKLKTPESLLATEMFTGETLLPSVPPLTIEPSAPAFVYNYYNLDPNWHSGENGNRILLLEPDFFKQYPVSAKCMAFIMALSKNILGLQVYVGSFQSLRDHYGLNNLVFKEHPLNTNYVGTEEPRDWISEYVTEYYPSFFSYWKKIEKQLYKDW